MIIHTFNFEKLINSFREKNIKKLKQNTQQLFDFLINGNITKFDFFYHPLGFIYCKLYVSKNSDEIIRLHIWDSEFHKIATELDIHTHYYEINSFVIKGQIVNEVYSEKIDYSEDYEKHYIYKGEYLNDNRILKKTDSFLNLIKSNKEIIKQNELYKIELNTFHKGYPSNFEEMTATIVFNENHQAPNPIIVGTENLSDNMFFKTTQVDSSIIQKILTKLFNPPLE
ncbi:hypothetical protein [Flavobacterium sp. C3NV]|uniref:hypothetical protein n=1 Tax=Flavobacterium sp. C3NV TaxID=3393358 RepID=UPI00398F92CD